ncbi:Restriction endonuclease [Bradyrhizobium canariense]|uniref:Restriction endonuclease n=1 Tax=Bradyrhizobium canariense TaxID=255045 RepID=A0A1H1XHX9_9BRAD|nr:Restriction endonuclease [Bradyrhizobium canariense]
MGDAGRSISFDALGVADLHVDAVYEGGRSGNAGDDPFPRLLRVSNQGGFRYRGSLAALEMVVLTSSMSDANWPDELDRETGAFTYYGDNKQPGRALHATPRNGNELLRRIFAAAHEGETGRRTVPPIFVFGNTGDWRDVMFLGLAVPGTSEQQVAEDLVAIWRTANGMRFQNYRARFTILNAPLIERTWIEEVIAGTPHTHRAPQAWTDWMERGRYQPLKSTRAIEYRTKIEQLPSGAEDLAIIREVHQFFGERPHDFEKCAAALARLMLPDIAELDLTRPSRDGGRDAIGKLRLGHGIASILVDFALEAKCYALDNSVGVREMSRLISRLRHRQFGILVTTSYVDLQAYREIKEDQHPIIVISARDIAGLLRRHGHADATAVRAWLDREFSAPTVAP